MSSSLRRVAVVLAAYAVIAWIVVGGAGWLRRVMALPELFDVLLRGGLVVGIPLAIVLAWRYPELGHGGATTDPESGR